MRPATRIGIVARNVPQSKNDPDCPAQSSKPV
jgi:hypothetical protein